MAGPRHRIDPDGLRLPIKLDTTSNGEFVPVPLSPANREANRLAHEAATANAKRVGTGHAAISWSPRAARRPRCSRSTGQCGRGPHRRLVRRAGRRGARSAARGGDARRRASSSSTCRATTSTRRAPGSKTPPARRVHVVAESRLRAGRRPGARGHLDCLGPDEFVKDVFLDSDTDMMVLSFVPSTARRRAAHDRGGGCDAAHRRSPGGHAAPAAARPRQSQPAGRRRSDGRARGAAGASPRGRPTRSGARTDSGFFLTTTSGSRFIEKARALGVKVHLRAQGSAVRAAVLRAQPVPRHRRRREALSRT